MTSDVSTPEDGDVGHLCKISAAQVAVLAFEVPSPTLCRVVTLQPGHDHHCRGMARRSPHTRTYPVVDDHWSRANVGVTEDRGQAFGSIKVVLQCAFLSAILSDI